MRMTAVRVGSVEKAQAVVITIQEQVRQALHSQRSLIGVMPGAHSARPHGEKARLNPGSTERNSFIGVEFPQERGQSQHRAAQATRDQPGRSHYPCRAQNEFATFHGITPTPDILDVLLSSEFVRKSRYFLLCQLRGHCSQEK